MSEPTLHEVDKRLAVLAGSHDALKSELGQLKDEIGKLNKNLMHLVWVVISAVVVAILNLVIKGH